MSNVYAINASTLTALGDAVRGATGKYTRIDLIPTVLKWSGTAQPKTNNTLYQFDFGTNIKTAKIRLVSSSGPMATLKAGSKTITLDDNGEFIYENVNDTWFYIFVNALSITEPFTFEFEVTAYLEDGTPVGQEGEVENTMTLSQMTEELGSVTSGLTAEDLNITGSLHYRFANGGWDWFIKKYGNRITTENINNINSAFENSQVSSIPFELNFASDTTIDSQGPFNNCSNLTSLPKTNNLRLGNFTYAFYNCHNLREVNSEFISGIDYSAVQQNNYYSFYFMFSGCYSLRKVPIELLRGICNPTTGSYDSYFNNGFFTCYNLDEAIGLPVITNGGWTEDILSGTFRYCCRLKELTFETNEDGTPKVAEWANQVLGLSEYVGYYPGEHYAAMITDYNSGIDANNNKVFDGMSYYAYKNSPDWYTFNFAYSRYNKQSAINTINSLPDTSEFANENGANLIMFKSGSGSGTDGGNISNLTDEEIAVAAAKGWTVSLV